MHMEGGAHLRLRTSLAITDDLTACNAYDRSTNRSLPTHVSCLFQRPELGKSAEVRHLFPILQQRTRAQAGTLSGEQKMLELGRTMVLETKALAIADYSIVLQQGRLALAGAAQEIHNHPKIGHLFLGGVVHVKNVSR